MPITYLRDDSRRHITVTGTGPVTLADSLAIVERQHAEGTWSYGLLIDARLRTESLKPSDTQVLVTRVRELIAAHGRRGPIAFVAQNSAVISSAHLYKHFAEQTNSMEIFWDMADARVWLDQQMVQTPDVQPPVRQ